MTQREQRPGVVEVRFSGDRKDIATVARLLAGRVAVLAESGPRANRRDPGVRVYLTIRVGGGAG